MTVARRDWRIHLEPGDTVSIDATYDVRRASWYESMGILSLGWTPNDDPNAKDPFEDAAAVRSMYRERGALTHRRLPENVDTHARDDLKLPDPRKLRGERPRARVRGRHRQLPVRDRRILRSARLPERAHAPPVVGSGESLTFTNQDALLGQPQDAQAWHTITACRAPCNKGTGNRLPARERHGRLRLRPARLRNRPQRQRHDRLQHLLDTAARRAEDRAQREADHERHDLHVLLPPPSVHARLLPGPRAGELSAGS